MKRSFQNGVTELARSFGFSDVSQLRPFMDQRNDLKAARRRLETHFDNIASEHGVERAIVIACVTASGGLLRKAEASLAAALSRRGSEHEEVDRSGADRSRSGAASARSFKRRRM